VLKILVVPCVKGGSRDDMASCRGRTTLFRECVIVGVGAGTEGSLFTFPGEDEGGVDVIRALRSRVVDRVQRASKSNLVRCRPSGGILALAWKKKKLTGC